MARRVAKPLGPAFVRDEDSPEPKPPPPDPESAPIEAEGVAGPVRRQSTYVSGISSRKRDGGLYDGWPQALRIVERVT